MHICLYSDRPWSIPDAAFEPDTNRISRVVGDLGSMTDKLGSLSPDVVFLRGFEQTQSLADALTNLANLRPSTIVIPIIQSPTADFLINAMRTGVREVLSNDGIDDVSQAVARIKDHISPRKEDQKKASTKKIGFMSAKGGDGGSFISANLASALAHDGEHRILLLDLAIPFGDVEMYLSSDPSGSDLADITGEISRLDHTLLASMVHRISDHFDFIASPRSFEKIINLDPANIEKLIKIADKNYDFVIVDVGSGFDPITLRTIESLDVLFLILTPSIPSIRRAGQIIRLLDSIGFSTSKLALILNKWSSKEPITPGHIENTLKKNIARKLTTDTEGVRESVIKGTPYVNLHKNSELTQAVEDLADDWLGRPKEDKSIWHRFGIK